MSDTGDPESTPSPENESQNEPQPETQPRYEAPPPDAQTSSSEPQSEALGPDAPAPGYTVPYSPPPIQEMPPTETPRSSSTGLIVGLSVGGGLLILLLIVGVATWFFGVARGTPEALDRLGDSASEQELEAAGDQVVEFMEALADSDATTALEFVNSYGDDSLLTDEVLRRSNELAPIDDIEVTSSEQTAYADAEIEVSFTLGGEPASRVFDVFMYGDEATINNGLSSIYLNIDEEFGLRLNDVEVDAEEGIRVFPGAYEFTINDDRFMVSGLDGPLLVSDEDSVSNLYDLEVKPTEATIEMFRGMVRDAVEECVQSREATTPCGFEVLGGGERDGYRLVEGTVTRTLSAEGEAALNSLDVRTSYATPKLLQAEDLIKVSTTFEFERDGTQTTMEDLTVISGYASLDLGQEEPELRWD